MSNKIRFEKIQPLNPSQELFFKHLENKALTIAYGSAGSGKTLLAVSQGIRQLQNREVRKIITVRPAVTTEKLGFLPGDLEEKLDPYMKPIWDSLEMIIGITNLERFRQQGRIEIAPIAYMRGRTFNDSYIILDEAQNTTIAQMKLFLTRIGNGSKVVLTGDLSQSDIPGRNGLEWVLEIFNDSPFIGICKFENKDVVRSELAKHILEAIDKYENYTS